MSINTASKEWRERPADERFWTLQEMLEYVRTSKEEDVEISFPRPEVADLIDGNIAIVSGDGEDYCLTNWSMQQLCNRLGAPHEFLTRLPVQLVADCLNEVSRGREWPTETMALVNRRGKARRITSNRYTTIWDADVVGRLLELESQGWRVPPGRPNGDSAVEAMARPATEDDLLRNAAHPSLAIHLGDPIVPSGIYAGDRDMFAFLIDENHPIEDPITKSPLYRGFIVANSEVGYRSFSLSAFLFHSVCGNHIIWGAQELFDVRIRHIGAADQRYWIEVQQRVGEYAHRSANDDIEQLRRWQTYRIADTSEEAVKEIFAAGLLSKKRAIEAIDLAATLPEAGDPLSVWGVAQALTRMSQSEPYADRRTMLDEAAAGVLRLAA